MTINAHTDLNPHQPYQITWLLHNGKTGAELNRTSGVHPVGTWWPDLYFNLFKLLAGSGIEDWNEEEVKTMGFYTCPGYKQDLDCRGGEEYFCYRWSCVTSNDGYDKWQVTRKDLITMQFADQSIRPFPSLFHGKTPVTPAQRDTHVKISFTPQGRADKRWFSGLTWGVALNVQGRDPGTLLSIYQVIEPVRKSLGPNKILISEKLKSITPFFLTTPAQDDLMPTMRTEPSPAQGAQEDPLWMMLVSAYLALNATNPNATSACWLCYDIRPPYYEAVGLNGTYSTSPDNDPKGCRWGSRNVGLTMQSVLGAGICIGEVPTGAEDICTIQRTINKTAKWSIPGQGGWWMCSKTGLTPCINNQVFEPTQEYCVMVFVFPRLLYHTDSAMFSYLHSPPGRVKRGPIAVAIGLTTLFGIVGTSAGLVSLSLLVQNSRLSSLQEAVDKDIDRIEKSISYLEKSLSSLSEVVLQNRRGLDLVFLQQGGLCMALGEECCFYADHTGVVRDSMARVRESLAKRERERKHQEGWFESWFSSSPWLTTLLSTLLGPLIVLVLILTFGSCVLNRLVTFVKDRV